MSGAFEEAMELERMGLSHIIDKSVCENHFSDEAIKKFIRRKSVKGQCSYCADTSRVLSFDKLMPFLMEGIWKIYADAVEFMPYDSAEGGYLGDHFDGNELIVDRVELDTDDYQLTDDIVGCIADIAWCLPNEDNERDIDTYHWEYFKKVLKHKSRYLFSQSKAFRSTDYQQNAYDILKKISRKITQFGLITTIPPNTKLFRCRQHHISNTPMSAAELAAPPEIFATVPNRMSPAGISMFYGAFKREIAKLETLQLPHRQNKHCTSGYFTPKKDLIVVDFTRLPDVPSIFDKVNVKNYYAVIFLREFTKDLSKPIAHDGREHIEYVPTQVVTEFIRFIYSTQFKSRVQGIVYSSAKNSSEKACVLFFDNQECLEELNFSKASLQTELIS